MTAFRRLSELGYLSSYSHAGRYYTLADIPQFDDEGLWLHEGVGFSRHGTLKATVPVLVDRSPAGLCHRDLQTKLQVRVHNTLLELVQAKRLRREPFGDEFLYVSAVRAQARAQLERRRVLAPAPAATSAAAPPPALVVEILLEVIHAAGIRASPAAVAARLAGRGVATSVAQVEAVFRAHDLPVKKTPRSRSAPSRR
jgi:hypothetical protein